MTRSRICDEVLESKCIGCGKRTYGLIKSLFSFHGVKSNRNKLRVVDKFIAVSSFVKKVHMTYLALDSRHIVVIPNFYEVRKEEILAEQNSKMKKGEIFPEDFILFVGILAPYKGVNTLIESCHDMNRRTKLVLIGVKDKNHSYGTTDNTIVIENASDNLVREAYSKCRFSIIPSIWPDPCPTVAFEAMAFKRPTIASAVGGLSEIVKHNETGLVVPPNNPSELAKAIGYLLERPALVQEMGMKGYNRLIEHFSVDKVTSRIETVYEEVNG